MRSFSITLIAAAVAAAAGVPALAQTRVRTEVIRPPAAQSQVESEDITGSVIDRDAQLAPAQGAPEIITDLAQLPAPVAQMRERILAAARTGRLADLVALMRSGATMPIFSLDEEKDPVAYWKASFPDSDGVEILATVIDILEAGCVHVDVGGPGEMYVWPYFARMPVRALTAAQKVELFKIVTGADYKAMVAAGAYNFFRVGIGTDGAWRFFVTGD